MPRRFGPIAMLFLAAVPLLIIHAQPGKSRPQIARHVRPEKTADPRLEAAIRKYLDVADGEAASLKYFYDRVDLNGDGTPEALVYVTGQPVCGTGGCTALVLRQENGAWAAIAQINPARVPIIVSNKQTGGWRDLILPVAGGGANPGYAVLRFDGAHYPENPTVSPAHRSERKIGGTAYLSGAGVSDAGLPLRPRESRQQ